MPLHCTAIGKMFLSHMPEQQRKEFVQTIPLRRYTGNTITDPERLLAELRRIQEAGVATDNQEFMSGVVCVAAPITGADGRIKAAVALSAPEARLTLEQALEHVAALRRAARAIGETLSGDREPALAQGKEAQCR